MVIGIVGRIASTAFKYRKQIYRVLVAQDRAIDRSFKTGGYSRSTRYGVRHGALAGSIIGTIITANAPDSPGNELQEPFQKKQPSANKQNKTRYRSTARYRSQQQDNKYFDRRQRQSCPSKYSRSGNRFYR